MNDAHYSLLVVLYTDQEVTKLALLQQEHMPLGVTDRKVADAQRYVCKKLGIEERQLVEIRLVMSQSPLFTFKAPAGESSMTPQTFVPDIRLLRS